MYRWREYLPIDRRTAIVRAGHLQITPDHLIVPTWLSRFSGRSLWAVLETFRPGTRGLFPWRDQLSGTVGTEIPWRRRTGTGQFVVVQEYLTVVLHGGVNLDKLERQVI